MTQNMPVIFGEGDETLLDENDKANAFARLLALVEEQRTINRKEETIDNEFDKLPLKDTGEMKLAFIYMNHFT